MFYQTINAPNFVLLLLNPFLSPLLKGFQQNEYDKCLIYNNKLSNFIRV